MTVRDLILPFLHNARSSTLPAIFIAFESLAETPRRMRRKSTARLAFTSSSGDRSGSREVAVRSLRQTFGSCRTPTGADERRFKSGQCPRLARSLAKLADGSTSRADGDARLASSSSGGAPLSPESANVSAILANLYANQADRSGWGAFPRAPEAHRVPRDTPYPRREAPSIAIDPPSNATHRHLWSPRTPTSRRGTPNSLGVAFRSL
jgi:hypothetical protein